MSSELIKTIKDMGKVDYRIKPITLPSAQKFIAPAAIAFKMPKMPTAKMPKVSTLKGLPKIGESEKAYLSKAGIEHQSATKTLKKSIFLARKETNTSPSVKQIESENYKKGKFKWKGFTIALENPKGSTRSGVDPDGNKWSIKMKHDYGYIMRTKSKADGDAVDIFMGNFPESNIVYIVDQINKDGSFDEHKCILGVRSVKEAKETYLSNYDKGWVCGKVTGMTVNHFKDWVKNGNTGKPVSEMNLFKIK